MNDKKFNGFMIFLMLVMLVFFVILGVGLASAVICSLILVLLVRAGYFVYSLLYDFLGGVSFGTNTKREI